MRRDLRVGRVAAGVAELPPRRASEPGDVASAGVLLDLRGGSFSSRPPPASSPRPDSTCDSAVASTPRAARARVLREVAEGAGALDDAAPRRAPRRRATFSSEVLPAPLRPTRPTLSPARSVNERVLHDQDAADLDGQITNLQHVSKYACCERLFPGSNASRSSGARRSDWVEEAPSMYPTAYALAGPTPTTPVR